MPTHQTPELRTFHPLDLEVRRGGDGRTVTGIAVPFGVVTAIRSFEGNYDEVFNKGAFTKTIAERGDRVKALAMHDAWDKLPLGKASLLREDNAGLYCELRVSKTQQGDEVLELVRDGALDAFSIGFRPIRDKWSADRSQVERLEVRLDEISLVAFPAYEDAKVLAVRTQQQPEPKQTPRLDAWRARYGH